MLPAQGSTSTTIGADRESAWEKLYVPVSTQFFCRANL